MPAMWGPAAEYILAAAGGFLLGSVPFAYLIGRARGLDLRTLGSGNVGATNLGRNAGLTFGLIAFALDAAKGSVPVLTARFAGGEEATAVIAGGAAVLGHCYSPFLGFRGGKGVATMAGAIAVLAPGICAALLLTWGVTVAIVRIIGISSSVTAAVGLVIGVWLLASPPDHARPAFAVLLIALSLLVIVRHRSNLRKFFTRPSEEAQ
jgi:glycerol-3-phosphate acyltransferase PlsY